MARAIRALALVPNLRLGTPVSSNLRFANRGRRKPRAESVEVPNAQFSGNGSRNRVSKNKCVPNQKIGNECVFFRNRTAHSKAGSLAAQSSKRRACPESSEGTSRGRTRATPVKAWKEGACVHLPPTKKDVVCSDGTLEQVYVLRCVARFFAAQTSLRMTSF